MGTSGFRWSGLAICISTDARVDRGVIDVAHALVMADVGGGGGEGEKWRQVAVEGRPWVGYSWYRDIDIELVAGEPEQRHRRHAIGASVGFFAPDADLDAVSRRRTWRVQKTSRRRESLRTRNRSFDVCMNQAIH